MSWFLMAAFTPHVNVSALHNDARLSPPTTDAYHCLGVEYVAYLVRRLLVRCWACLFYISKSQTLVWAFTPWKEISWPGHSNCMSHACRYMNYLWPESRLRQSNCYLRGQLDYFRNFGVWQTQTSVKTRTHWEDAVFLVNHDAVTFTPGDFFNPNRFSDPFYVVLAIFFGLCFSLFVFVEML